MDWAQIIGLVGGLLSLGTIGFNVYKANSKQRLDMESSADEFSRQQIRELRGDIAELNKKIDEQKKFYEDKLAAKDVIIEKKEKENGELRQELSKQSLEHERQIGKLGNEIRELRHQINGTENTKGLIKEVDELKH